ncbi:tRNA lysidine(34) synthetase TilS [Erythrobacter alti]|uniref:tRNA lysidine(34) synthetase TilS n=1 Tax=Erythrobacter alti TaxID=1896145 RepID=UPI0030F43291
MPGSTAIDAELVERFKNALDRLNPEAGKLGLAVSGGPDSMAMLLLAQEAIPGGFEVATVDHGLRSEAKDECALVVSACEDRSVPCEVLSVRVGVGNVQTEARTARYDALADWVLRQGLQAIATAHHADDQVETLLMRLNRGAGLTGLAGIRARGEWGRQEVQVLRPMLQFRRAELAGVVAASGLETADDPSNSDRNFDRVRMRQALAQVQWVDVASMSASASNLAEAAEALGWVASEEFSRQVRQTGDEWRYCPLAPRAVRLIVVNRLIVKLGAKPRGGQVADLVDALQSGSKGNLGGVLASVEGAEWVFRPEPPRKTG